MDRTEICKELIKVANKLDESGDFELANELTKTAGEIANRLAFRWNALKPFFMQGKGQSQDNYVQIAYRTGNQALYQKATALQQKEMGLNQEKKALMQELVSAIKNPQLAQSSAPVVQTQGATPTVSQPNMGIAKPSMGANQLATTPTVEPSPYAR